MSKRCTSILYVDDDMDDHVILRELLEEAEGTFDLECVTDYDTALDRLLTGEHDICLLDYLLGDRSGLDLLREAGDRGSQVPVIILTGRGGRSLDVQASELGAVDYLVKSDINPQVVERTIRYAVSAARASKELRDSEERYALAAQGANDGLWDWDLKTNTITFSSRWKSIFGFSDSEVTDSPGEWLGRVHPDDRLGVEASVADHINGGSDHFESAHRMRDADGTYRWVLVRASAARSHNGKAYRIAGSHMDTTQLRHAQSQLIERTFFDEVTQLPNRDLLVDRAALCLSDVRSNNGLQCAMLVVRVAAADSVYANFSTHDADAFIVEAARRLSECVRPGDTIARLGQGQFGVLLTDVAGVASAIRAGERLQGVLGRPFLTPDGDVSTSTAVGVAVASHATSADDLLRRALVALGQAVVAGSGSVRTFDAGQHARSKAGMHLVADLRSAVIDEAMTVHYQPIVSLRTGRITSFEALVRWNHPVLHLLAPDQFLPLAEETGLVRGIDRFVLRTAALQMAEWHGSFPAERSLAIGVNFSGRHFHDPNVVASILTILESSGLEGRHLHLELTETALLQEPEVAVGILNELARQGISIVIDDFGTGYSSLSYLHRLPVSTLKIDRSFVSALGSGAAAVGIVHSIVAMAQELGVDVIAEGVETPAQLKQLKQLDCSKAQGYLFSRPVDAAQAGALIAEQAATPDSLLIGGAVKEGRSAPIPEMTQAFPQGGQHDRNGERTHGSDEARPGSELPRRRVAGRAADCPIQGGRDPRSDARRSARPLRRSESPPPGGICQ